MALFKLCRGGRGVRGVVTHCDDGLGVVVEEHVNVFSDYSATASRTGVLIDLEVEVPGTILEYWRWRVGGFPPRYVLRQVHVLCYMFCNGPGLIH